MMDFSHKTVLITGASRGIGAATARLFAASGAKVAINYWSAADSVNPDAAQQLLEEIRAAGGTAALFNADITNSFHVNKMVESVNVELGEITHLILNAFIPFQPKSLLDYEWDEFNKKVSSDVKSYFLLAKAILPSMINKKYGVVLGVSSGLSRYPGPYFSPYSLSKAALNSFIRSIALEYGSQGIRANVIAPGFTATDPNKHVSIEERQSIAAMTPLRRTGEPEDIAKVVVMMASDYAQFISGGYLPVDGGFTMP
jgi:3-oxoacyl-[acyl-carrier protein] reductase